MNRRRRHAIVTVDDMREVADHELRGSRLPALQQEQSLGRWSGEVDAGRVLIVDEVTALGRRSRQDYYGRLLAAGSVDKVICLAVGPPQEAGGVVLSRLQSMQPPYWVTVWVGSTSGVPWDGGNRKATTFPSALAEPGHEMVDRLMEVLGEPEIFDQVLEEAAHLPDSVGTPGLRLVLGRLDGRSLTPVIATATEEVVGRPRQDSSLTLSGAPLTLLTGRADLGGHEGESFIRPDGAFGTMQRECAEAIDVADQLTTRMGGIFGLVGGGAGQDVGAHIAAAGERLRDYRDRMKEAFWNIEGSRGVERYQAELVRLGVRLDPPPGLDAAHVGRALRDFVQHALQDRQPLRVIAAVLLDYARKAVPQGSSDRAREADDICSDSFIDQLMSQPEMPLVPPVWGIVFGAALSCFASGAGVLGSVLAGFSVLLWLILLWRMHVRVPKPFGVSPRPAELATYSLYGFAGLAGGVAGVVLATRIPIPADVAVVLAVVGPLGLVATASFGWKWAVSRWRRGLGLRAAGNVLKDLNGLLGRVTLNEWVLGGARRHAADASRDLSRTIDRVAELMREHRKNDPSDESGDPAVLPPGVADEVARYLRDHGGEVRAVIRDDLVGMVSAVLAPIWPPLERGALSDTVTIAERAIAGTLVQYDDHLARAGIQEPPPFGAPIEKRTALVEAVWRSATEAGALLLSDPAEAGLIQLTDPAQFNLLEPGGEPVVVRFAPRAGQAVISARLRESMPVNAAPPGEITWTASGQNAGILRLSPLRTGSVRTEWSFGDGEEGDR